MPVLAGDANPEVADLLVADRAAHFWDGKRKLGYAVGRMLGDKPASVGSPVISDSGELERALHPYLVAS
jgi:hypothetical protein